MPAIQLKATDDYLAGLDRLIAEAEARSHALPTRAALLDLAVSRLARAWKVELPRRMPPVGTNRFGEPAA